VNCAGFGKQKKKTSRLKQLDADLSRDKNMLSEALRKKV
jgi:hypothetical protein